MKKDAESFNGFKSKLIRKNGAFSRCPVTALAFPDVHLSDNRNYNFIYLHSEVYINYSAIIHLDSCYIS